jgi:hypothetical protein
MYTVTNTYFELIYFTRHLENNQCQYTSDVVTNYHEDKTSPVLTPWTLFQSEDITLDTSRALTTKCEDKPQ